MKFHILPQDQSRAKQLYNIRLLHTKYVEYSIFSRKRRGVEKEGIRREKEEETEEEMKVKEENMEGKEGDKEK